MSHSIPSVIADPVFGKKVPLIVFRHVGNSVQQDYFPELYLMYPPSYKNFPFFDVALLPPPSVEFFPSPEPFWETLRMGWQKHWMVKVFSSKCSIFPTFQCYLKKLASLNACSLLFRTPFFISIFISRLVS